jgi:hypothetical protein
VIGKPRAYCESPTQGEEVATRQPGPRRVSVVAVAVVVVAIAAWPVVRGGAEAATRTQLARQLADPDPQQRKRGAWRIADPQTPAWPRQALLDRLAAEPVADVRESLVYALGMRGAGDADAVAAVRGVVVGDADGYVRQAAWLALARVDVDGFWRLAAEVDGGHGASHEDTAHRAVAHGQNTAHTAVAHGDGAAGEEPSPYPLPRREGAENGEPSPYPLPRREGAERGEPSPSPLPRREGAENGGRSPYPLPRREGAENGEPSPDSLPGTDRVSDYARLGRAVDEWDRLGVAKGRMELGDFSATAGLFELAARGPQWPASLAAEAVQRWIAPLLDAVGRWPLAAVERPPAEWPPELLDEIAARCVALDVERLADETRPYLLDPEAQRLRSNVGKLASARSRVARLLFWW